MNEQQGQQASFVKIIKGKLSLLIKIVFLFLFVTTATFGDELSDKLNKIDKQLNSLKELKEAGALGEKEYIQARKKLNAKADAARKAAAAKKKTKVVKKTTKQTGLSEKVTRQLEVIDKLLKDGVLTQEEYNKTRKNLLDKAKNEDVEIKEPKKRGLTPTVTIAKSNKISWEKAEIIYGDYRIYTHRPGGVKIKRISDGKQLVVISDNYKVKYYNGGKDVFDIEISKKERPSWEEESRERARKLKEAAQKALEDPLSLFKKKEFIPFDKNEHKLVLRKDGVKLLQYEGRFVPKHDAFFYQVFTGTFTPFHFYIKIRGKTAISLNMEMFNKKIDKAVAKAKKKLAVEYDVTEAQIDEIINKKVEEEADRAVNEALEEAVSQSVEQAIQESVGEAMSRGLVEAIEAATGEAIDDALEAELASAIDQEIARAVAMGIEEAAVTAGWQAYFDTLAAGGTEAQANAAAYEACGSACDGY